MNRNDEHLIFGELNLFEGYLVYPNKTGFVEVLTHMDMEICLENHHNWDRIRHQPPILVYDCPSFVSQTDLMDYFCGFTHNRDELDHICNGLDGNEKRQPGKQIRDYRVVFYGADDPTKPIGFTSFDLMLDDNIEQQEVDAEVNLVGLRCDFLYAYVIPAYRDMGIGAMMGLIMGTLYWQQLHHVWLQLNGSDSALLPLIYAEGFGRGGREIIKTVLREIKMFSDMEHAEGRINHLRMPKIVTQSE